MSTCTCPYCGSNLERINEKQYYCEFCVMNVAAEIVQKDGGRLPVRKVTEFVLDAYTHKTTPELMILSTFELLYLLSCLRKERSSMYGLFNTFRKVGEETGEDDFKDSEQESIQEYENVTRKMFVVENIIRQRLGYVPNRITEKALATYQSNMLKDKKGPMVIRKERKEKVQTKSSVSFK
ncbi:hypothetical protein [Priestia endophytica]|uniref:Uncharacterized protein n=1 Tax=Priestia endophytica DSM 13796 TaxID=1121089 RepID=A0A1I6C070_9BACI|nr:hypothetical protein [Priestia endophytica]KYG33454.1 hypothetical protein AZF06_21660 [Priestia endophytica]SFQ86573.1 hypothetical protein SAMN02745910_04671 [Priestia endophytica DSM 13796]